MWKYESKDDRMSSISALHLIGAKLNQMKEFAKRLSCINDSVQEAFGEPDKPGDEHKIIAVVEKEMRIYMDVITWKLSFQDLYVAVEYRNVVEQICGIAEGVCKGYDLLYSKLLTAKKQLEDLSEGLIDPKDLHIDISITIDVDMDGVNHALKELLETMETELV